MRAGEKLWAIGDVAGHGAFTHVSMYQSAVALRDLLGQDGPPAAYHAVPHVTFTDPEVGGVGLTEQQARDAGLSVRVGSTPLEYSSRGFTHGAGARGLVKVVEDADRGVLVGATRRRAVRRRDPRVPRARRARRGPDRRPSAR